MTTGQKILSFYERLEPPVNLPEGVGLLNPYKSGGVQAAMHRFYSNYFPDNAKRVFLIGINPGRFGAGITGIPFTDPVCLEGELGIANDFEKRGELSSRFIYEIIGAFGGPKRFYRHFFITSVYPYGFVKDGKNMNYYDDRKLLRSLENDMVRWLDIQVSGWACRKVAFSVGKGKNYEVLKRLNKANGWFDEIRHIPHPRWVLQYRLQQKPVILEQVVSDLAEVINHC